MTVIATDKSSGAAPSMGARPKKSWQEIEDKFRLWAFRVYYEKSFALERDLAMRFIKALIASSQPIPDRQAVIAWYGERRRKKHSPALEERTPE